jgi:hypothetical protein
LPRPLGVDFTRGIVNLPNGDRRQGSAPNIVIFFPPINQIYFHFIT